MIQRFRQFSSALTAKVSPAEYTYVHNLLSPEEERLFRAMDLVDQRHCLDVARTCLDLVGQVSQPVDKTLLLKSALLHDVGKRRGDLKLWHRVAIVLMHIFCPGVFHRLAEKQNSPYYISKYHPVIGAKLCSCAGCTEKLVQMVQEHHSNGVGLEVNILRRADDMN